MIGYCKIKDIEKFYEWLMEAGYRRKRSFSSGLYGGWFDDNWSNYFYGKQEIFGACRDNIFKDSVEDTWFSNTEKFKELLSYLETVNQRLEVFYSDDFASLIGYNNTKFVMPTEWLEIEYLQDYSSLSMSELKALGVSGGPASALAVTDDFTRADVERKIDTQNDKLEELKKEMEDVNDAKTGELAELQAEIEKMQNELEERKQKMMTVLKEKKAEMEAKKAELEQQVFMLDTQIYGIRCYLGEVIKFTQVRNGKNASAETPVALFQKIRYLDEEMGKAIALYQYDADDNDTFIEVLKYRDDIRDLFVPSDKCISLVRVSKTGAHTRQSSKIENMLQKYETYHGGQLGVIIRNGENLYVTWLDQDRISIGDGNVFYQYKNETDTVDEDVTEHKSSKSEVVSRYFIFALLQGILDNTKIINLPEQANILNPGKYVVYSVADGWLDDNRYGTFSEIVDRVKDIPMKQGDMILTLIRIGRDDAYSSSERYRKYNNDRGIGDKNRTHDCFIGQMKVLPVNKVVKNITYKMHYDKLKVTGQEIKTPHKNGGYSITFTNPVITDEILEQKYYTFTVSSTDDYSFMKLLDMANPYNEDSLQALLEWENQKEMKDICIDATDEKVRYVRRITKVEVESVDCDYYLSAAKNHYEWEGKKQAYANLQFYESEVLPLNYLNSGWIRYVISSQKVGRWYAARDTLTYADALPYLNKMLEYLDKREKSEKESLIKAGLSDWVESNPDWMVQVCEWRIENQIRNLTEAAARKFAKKIQNV